MEFVISFRFSPTYHRHGLRFVETREIVEIAVLVKLVEYRSGSVLELRSSEDGDAIARKEGGETGASLGVFESGDTGGEFASFEKVWVGFVEGLSELKG